MALFGAISCAAGCSDQTIHRTALHKCRLQTLNKDAKSAVHNVRYYTVKDYLLVIDNIYLLLCTYYTIGFARVENREYDMPIFISVYHRQLTFDLLYAQSFPILPSTRFPYLVYRPGDWYISQRVPHNTLILLQFYL